MTSTGSNPDSLKALRESPLIFLDTNAVHYTRLALAFAKGKKRKILNCNLENFQSTIKASKARGNASKSILAGYQIARYLAQQSKKMDARVQYAPVSGFELLCGGLRGRAILNAAKCRVPHRWYSKLVEIELLQHLEEKDFQENRLDHANLSSLFQDQLGFPILESKESDLGRVFSLAQTILSAMYLELGDCLVYASALLARASQVVTDDGHLRSVIRGIENSGCASEEYKIPCAYARRLIQPELANLLEIEERMVLFPNALGSSQLKVKAITGSPRD